ncbi:hypothetical protein Y5S_02225 [Alcanivorax nanhaiticus]|uniref:Uncharacterized protein n=1 Tax=Alcanivorax nanhaiticus TaxID=1177154 RepID=A0A095UPL7_9GAMM|nr:hypothetical protein Y5S_02225 [Alcanivorax nanhaiticus]
MGERFKGHGELVIADLLCLATINGEGSGETPTGVLGKWAIALNLCHASMGSHRRSDAPLREAKPLEGSAYSIGQGFL